MPTAQEPVARQWTVDDFLAWERLQEERYEFVDGVILPIAGRTVDHLQIAANILLAIGRQVRRRRMRIYPSGLRILAGSCVVYPDVVISSGPASPKAETIDPQVVVEVVSQRTADFDRGRKAVAYKTVPCLTHLVLVSQDRCRVDLLRRFEREWHEEAVIDPAASIVIGDFGAAVPLHDVYQGTSVAN